MIRLYILGGVLVALLIGGAALYAKGRIDARHAVEVQTLRDNITRLREDMDVERKARIADAITAKVDREEAQAEEAQIKELVDALPEARRDCFDAADADRLRALFEDRHTAGDARSAR